MILIIIWGPGANTGEIKASRKVTGHPTLHGRWPRTIVFSNRHSPTYGSYMELRLHYSTDKNASLIHHLTQLFTWLYSVPPSTNTIDSAWYSWYPSHKQMLSAWLVVDWSLRIQLTTAPYYRCRYLSQSRPSYQCYWPCQWAVGLIVVLYKPFRTRSSKVEPRNRNWMNEQALIYHRRTCLSRSMSIPLAWSVTRCWILQKAHCLMDEHICACTEIHFR